MCICEGNGKVGSVVHGMWLIEPCECNKGNWETTRKPQLEKLLKEARERDEQFRKNSGQEHRREIPLSQAL